MLSNRSAPPGPIVPVLTYRDVDKAIAWLIRAFGFSERLRTPTEPDGTIHHAQMAVGEGAIILSGQQVSGPQTGIQRLFVRVADVNAHFERAAASGAPILRPPADCAFGERQYTAQDLAGNEWTFSQSIEDVEPEAWGARRPGKPPDGEVEGGA
jgi:uncharacterized glyoxalase superfamily protein PhnB